MQTVHQFDYGGSAFATCTVDRPRGEVGIQIVHVTGLVVTSVLERLAVDLAEARSRAHTAVCVINFERAVVQANAVEILRAEVHARTRRAGVTFAGLVVAERDREVFGDVAEALTWGGGVLAMWMLRGGQSEPYFDQPAAEAWAREIARKIRADRSWHADRRQRLETSPSEFKTLDLTALLPALIEERRKGALAAVLAELGRRGGVSVAAAPTAKRERHRQPGRAA